MHPLEETRQKKNVRIRETYVSKLVFAENYSQSSVYLEKGAHPSNRHTRRGEGIELISGQKKKIITDCNAFLKNTHIFLKKALKRLWDGIKYFKRVRKGHSDIKLPTLLAFIQVRLCQTVNPSGPTTLTRVLTYLCKYEVVWSNWALFYVFLTSKEKKN